MAQGKIELYQQDLIMPKITPSESVYAEAPEPKKYSTDVKLFKLPAGRFDDPDKLISAYFKNKNSAMRSLTLAQISGRMRDDYFDMLKIVSKIPEAAKHVGEEIYHINWRDFFSHALICNPDVYHHLPEDVQKDKDIINAYAQGMTTNHGCKLIDKDLGKWCPEGTQFFAPNERVPIFKHAIHENCDKNVFYSPENYMHAHMDFINNGMSERDYIAPPMCSNRVTTYSSQLAYLQNARLYAEQHNPQLLEQYRISEARSIEKCLEKLTQYVQEDVHSRLAQQIAEDVAKAAVILDKHDPDVDHMYMLQTIAEAEKQYYIHAAYRIKEHLQGHHHSVGKQFVDMHIDKALQYPEMDIDQATIDEWWGKRGEDRKTLQDKFNHTPSQYLGYDIQEELNWLNSLVDQHPQMLLGEQMTIEGFEANEIEINK